MNTLAEPMLYKSAIYRDDRGFFSEIFSRNDPCYDLVSKSNLQMNFSYSRKNVFRGFHFQNPPFMQNKLVKLISGEIDIYLLPLNPVLNFDDIIHFHISHDSFNSIFIPNTYANSFFCNTDNCEIAYIADQPYSREGEVTISPVSFLKSLNLNAIISKKDENGILLEENCSYKDIIS